jgi:nucleotide-binding universal stress UspA family protein
MPSASHAAEAFACPLEPVHVPADEDPVGFDASGLRVLPRSDVARGLVAFARATDPPGLLCLSTRGRGAVGELVFGSVTAEVIRSLRAPLLAVGPSIAPTPPPWRRLLVCLDGSDNAAAVLPIVSAWAQRLDLEVSLRYVAYPLGDPRSGDLEVPDEDEVAAAQLQQAAAGLRALGVTTEWAIVEHTDVARGVADEAARIHSGLLAIATHGRTGLARLVAGSVALAVVRHASVPVLTLRPAGLD